MRIRCGERTIAMARGPEHGVRLLEELRRAAADGGEGALLGDALLAARRACLIDGHAAVLTLAVFGSTDWLLEPAQ